MLSLGLCGGLNRTHENPLELPGAFLHDGAAVIVRDGVVITAVEEERLNRIKHSNKFPVGAIRACLDGAGARLESVDRIAFYATERYCNALLGRLYAARPDMTLPLDTKLILKNLLETEFNAILDASKIVFVGHHQAHAVSVFAMSGFQESLILTIDGYGDFLSGLVAHGCDTDVTPIVDYAQENSLGLMYLEIIRFLGYGPFDEYKVMGLAPYGDPTFYREMFKDFYELGPDGTYRVFLDRIAPAVLRNIDVRRSGAEFTNQHQNIAASLQEALEKIVFHIVGHYRAATGLHNLCLAGGVAQNCTMNGKLLYSGLFENIFVQPAAHDAGCALGAALMMSKDLGHPGPRKRLTQVYWGPAMAERDEVEREVCAWRDFLEVERVSDLTGRVAELIAAGAVVGWVQGRSEFGPRALGNRSILADPRPAANKDRINAMIKKREGYRPFAPSVLEEDVSEFFDLPGGCDSFPFMTFVVRVREDKQGLLGAITHVDGTARLQTVSRHDNPLFWELIQAFKKLTGVPLLLNTSFNNNAEPIVDSVGDAIATFMTTGLDWLVVGPFLAHKRTATEQEWLSLSLSLPAYVRLHQSRGLDGDGRPWTQREVRTTFSSRVSANLSPALFDRLMELDGACRLADLLDTPSVDETERTVHLEEIRDLWARRLVRLGPAAPAEYAACATGRRDVAERALPQ